MQYVGCLGPEGSFSEEALYSLITQEPEVIPIKSEVIVYPTIPQLLRACEQREINWAFVPVENSIEGPVGATLDTLVQSTDLLIQWEFNHPIKQCLLTPRPIDLAEVERVYSHEQALGQCRGYLESNLANAEQIVCSSTAEAARRLAAARENWAAIAPRRAAELYNLHCQAEGIQDMAQNETRFALVGRHLTEMSGRDKTSLAIMTEHKPGALYQVLKEFAERNINLTHIESRPSKQKLGEYIFLVDLEGYVLTEAVQSVLLALKEHRVNVKFLGSYPQV